MSVRCERAWAPYEQKSILTMAVARKLFHPSDLELLEWDFGKFGNSIPGYRYGATFLSTLRTNIHLSNSDSLSSSTMSTPTSPPQPSTLLPHPNPSPLSITTPASSEEPSPPAVPALTTIPATTPTDRVEALRLIADSVAQQRQTASYAIITHPACLGTILCLLAILARSFDFPVFLTTTTGIIMAFLLAVRIASGPYLTHAENINWNWLVEGSSLAGNSDTNKKNKGEELIVLVTKWGEEIIGALAMRLSKRDRRAYIKAWTVKLRFRGKEVGQGLLEEAVKIAVSEKGCKGIEFEEEHANFHRVLPAFFNATFDKREARARKALADVMAEQKKKKKN